jgi:hypothetical protein
VNRREFVAASSAVAAAIGCSRLPAATLAESPHLNVSWVLFDRRFGPSRAFGSAAAGLMQRTYGIEGNVTEFWTEHLDPLWRGGTGAKAGAGAVAGMTTAATLVCLEQLAAQHWFRVIGRVEHQRRGEQTVMHRICAEPRWLRRLSGGLAKNGGPLDFATAWLEPGRRGIPQARAEFLTNTNPLWVDAPPLVSWYIAGRTTEVEI